MKRPAFLHGVVVAAVLAFITSAVVATLTPFVGFGSVLRFCIPAVALVYILYLLRASRERTGNITTLSLWSALAIATWWISPPLPYYVLIHVGAIWLVRSLYFHAGALPALMDMGLSALGVAAFAWAAARTGSVSLATWSFFLVQAMFVAIPASIRRRPTEAAVAGNAAFEKARRQADQALRFLANH